MCIIGIPGNLRHHLKTCFVAAILQYLVKYATVFTHDYRRIGSEVGIVTAGSLYSQ